MACSNVTLKGIGLTCRDNMGGIKNVYITKAENITATELDETSSQIGTITIQPEAKFSTYKFRKGTSDVVSTMTADEAAGVTSVQTQLNLQFSKQEAAKRLEIMGLCLEETVVVYQDSNDIYWLLGKDFPVTCTTATSNTGKSFTEFSGYNLTLTDDSKEFPYPLAPAAVAALKEAITPAPVVGA